MSSTFSKSVVFLLFVLTTPLAWAKIAPENYSSTNDTIKKKLQRSNVAPVLTATGNQFYCPGTAINIVTDMTIVDPDDLGIDAVYIQISSGYVMGEDFLNLTGSHPNITTTWNAGSGKLTLSGVTGQPTYVELVAAIKAIQFTSSASNPTGSRTFSITVGQANYLPSNGHYYQYVSNLGITWSNAKIAAQSASYYGLQGYLATLTSADEAQLAGVQASGAGWIGGSDEASEGVWKWINGPEAGTVFWNGNFSGSTATFAFWNSGEPNNVGGIENYAHITAPGVGIPGSWNDLPNSGDTSGNYQPKGYIVEYGGMPGDPVLQIATSTSLTIPSITSSSPATRCGTGVVTLQAISSTGIVNWYDAPSGGTLLGTGTAFTTPTITSTTVFYAAAHLNGCPDNSRISVTATVTPKPVITHNAPYGICEESNAAIDVQISSGILLWYDSATATSPIFTGTHFVVPNIHQNTVFYAEADSNGCVSDRIPILINVYPTPLVTDTTIDICQGATVILDAGNPNMNYLWSTGANTPSITSTAGLTDYSVLITTLPPANCQKTKHFSIIEHVTPIIATIEVNQNAIVIHTSNSGTFEYSVDGINFQDSNSFANLANGVYSAYARDKYGCGTDSKQFVIITIMRFFTPNGDGYNDVWKVGELQYYPEAEIKVFDRFGTLLSVLNSKKTSWDGSLNGSLLPSDDYWYVFKLDATAPIQKGHFTIKR